LLNSTAFCCCCAILAVDPSLCDEAADAALKAPETDASTCVSNRNESDAGSSKPYAHQHPKHRPEIKLGNSLDPKSKAQDTETHIPESGLK